MNKDALKSIIKEVISEMSVNKPYKFIYVGEGSGNVYGVSNKDNIDQAWTEFKMIVVRMSAGDASDANYDNPTIKKYDGYWSISYPESDEGGFFIIDIYSTNPIVQKEIKTLDLLKYADEYLKDKEEMENWRTGINTEQSKSIVKKSQLKPLIKEIIKALEGYGAGDMSKDPKKAFKGARWTVIYNENEKIKPNEN